MAAASDMQLEEQISNLYRGESTRSPRRLPKEPSATGVPAAASASQTTVSPADIFDWSPSSNLFWQEESPLDVYGPVDGNHAMNLDTLASSITSADGSPLGSFSKPPTVAFRTDSLDPPLYLDGLDWADPNVHSTLSEGSILTPQSLSPKSATDMTTTAPATVETETATKRQKGQSDNRSACWTSPLCPNHGIDGVTPNPSTCGGGCAPFLFNFDESLTLETARQDAPKIELTTTKDPQSSESVQPRSLLKRNESNTDYDPLRESTSQNAAKARPRSQRESPGDSPQDPLPQPAEEAKAISRPRIPHNQVERKYRETLNSQLESLRRVVPSLQQSPRTCDKSDIEDLPAPSKPSKAVVLASATSYIKNLEKDNKQLTDENEMLRNKVRALQDLVKCEDCSLMQYVVNMRINGS